jgi:tripartite-type tricarboxylate transporter receptor subunit TctC
MMRTFNSQRMSRRAVLQPIFTAAAACICPAVFSQSAAPAGASYPNASVKIIVGFAAGGGTDTVARAVAQVLSQRLGQAVTVENRPGASGGLAMTQGAAAAADGLTLIMGSNGTMVLNPLLQPLIKYQPEKDFLPLAGIASIPYLIAAHPALPANDIRSLVNLAKSQKISFASPGNGSTNHLVGVLLQSMAGVDMLHVPYRGAAPAMNDVIGGQVNFLSGDLATLMPMVNAGKLKALAVTAMTRAASLPQVPTVAESGFSNFEATGWFALFAPVQTPSTVAQRIAGEMTHVLKDERVLARLRDLGGTPMPLQGDQLRDLLQSETKKWRKVITDNKVTADALQ